MELLIWPAGLFLIITINLFINIIVMKNRDKLKYKLLVLLIIIFIGGGEFIDTSLIIMSEVGLYEVPVKEGYLSDLSFIDKIGVPSSLKLNGKEYKISSELLHKESYQSNLKYKVKIAPVTRTVLSIEK